MSLMIPGRIRNMAHGALLSTAVPITTSSSPIHSPSLGTTYHVAGAAYGITQLAFTGTTPEALSQICIAEGVERI